MAGKPQTSQRFAPVVAAGMQDAAITTRSQSWNAENRTFEFVLATETPVRAYRWDDWDRVEVDEQLDMSGLQDLDRLRGQPILDSHSYWSVDSVVGVIESARLENGQLICTGRLSARDDVADIAQDIADGILTNVSVGFEILEEVRTTRPGQKDLVRVTKWRAREASLVAVPADANANIRSSQRSETPSMTPEQIAAAEAARAAATTQQPAAPVVDANLATTIADAVRNAVTAALGQRSVETAPAQQPAAPAAPAVQTQPPADPVAGMRSIVQRRAADDPEVLQDFDDLVATGASAAQLGEFVQTLIGSRGEDIATGHQQRGNNPPAQLLRFEDTTTFKRAQANLGVRAAS